MRNYKKICIIVVLLFLLMSMWLYSIYSNKKANLYLENGVLQLAFNEEIIEGWCDTESNTVYFFLPSYYQCTSINWKCHEQNDKKECINIEYGEEYEINFTEDDSYNVIFLKSRNLSTVCFETSEEGEVELLDNKQSHVPAQMKIFSPKGNVIYQDDIEYITGRGYSSWRAEKKSFNIKLSDKVSILEMNANDSWSLLANVYEGTKMMNKLVFDMADYLDMENNIQCEWIDVYLNHKYYGNYLITEKVHVDNDKVIQKQNIVENRDFFKEESELEEFRVQNGRYTAYMLPANPNNISGTYLIELIGDELRNIGFYTENGVPFEVRRPDNASMEEVSYIGEFVQEVENAIDNNCDNIEELIDIKSFVQRYLIEEVSQNDDAFIISTYFYKKANDDKLYAGPLWDHDGCFGEGDIWENNHDSVFLLDEKYHNGTQLLWDYELMQNSDSYRNCLREEYEKLLEYTDYLLAEGIDNYAEYIRDSVEMDMLRWDYGKYAAGHYSTFDKNIWFLKYALGTRLDWLSEIIGVKEDKYQYEKTNEIHQVTFLIGTDTYVFEVADGEILPDENIPYLDNEKYVRYRFTRDNQVYHNWIPVLEDMEVYAERIE